MTQILKSLQLPITGSTPTTLPLGFGSVYASSSNKFYFKNSVGTEFDLVTTNGYINTLYYTGSNIGGLAKTYTWSPTFTGLKYIEVCCVGAGGGGGSGRKATTIRNYGGFGGGGGAIVWATFDASILASSYDIVVGAGGAGGIGQTTNNTNGNNGTNGGTSSFGTLVVARGGDGGIGGVATGNITTLGGKAILCTPAGIPYAINGCNTTVGGALTPGAPTNAGVATSNIRQSIIFNPVGFINGNDTILSGGGPRAVGFGGGAGGFGGTINGNISDSIISASRGSNGYQFDTLIINSGDTGSAGTINGDNATSPTDNMITTLLQFTGSTTLYGLGGGGHGGGTGITGNGGNGSPGGLYGAGGGAGGTVFNNTPLSSSGAGASGSSGLVIITEFY
jgi:hypothetical protein